MQIVPIEKIKAEYRYYAAMGNFIAEKNLHQVVARELGVTEQAVKEVMQGEQSGATA